MGDESDTARSFIQKSAYENHVHGVHRNSEEEKKIVTKILLYICI